MTDLEILIWMRRYFLLFLWRRCILRTTLLETTDLNWVAAARFLLLRFPVQLIALDRLFFFGQVVLLVLLFQESAPFSTHFVVARWFFTNTEEFLRVLKLELLAMTKLIRFLFISIFIILRITQMIILRLIFLSVSINNIIWVDAYVWNKALIIIIYIS
jgi:hypothetical protein